MKQLHVILILSVLLVGVVAVAVVRDIGHRAYREEIQMNAALFYAKAEHVIDSLTHVNVVLKNEAIEATAAGIEAVGKANYDQYLNDRKGIPTASDDSLKKLVLWQRPKQR